MGDYGVLMYSEHGRRMDAQFKEHLGNQHRLGKFQQMLPIVMFDSDHHVLPQAKQAYV